MFFWKILVSSSLSFLLISLVILFLYKKRNQSIKLQNKKIIHFYFSNILGGAILFSLLLNYESLINFLTKVDSFVVVRFPMTSFIIISIFILYCFILIPILVQKSYKVYKIEQVLLGLFLLVILVNFFLLSPLFSFYYVLTDFLYIIGGDFPEYYIAIGINIIFIIIFIIVAMMLSISNLSVFRKAFTKIFLLFFTFILAVILVPTIYTQIKLTFFGDYLIIPNSYNSQINIKIPKNHDNQNYNNIVHINNITKGSTKESFDIAGIGAAGSLSNAKQLNLELQATIEAIINTNDYFTKLKLSKVMLTEWVETSKYSDIIRLNGLKLNDGTSFEYQITPNTQDMLNKIAVLETFSANRIVKIYIKDNFLYIKSGKKVRQFYIKRRINNILTDSILNAGWIEYTTNWNINGAEVVTDLTIGAINKGYSTILNTIISNIFTKFAYRNILEKISFSITKQNEIVAEANNIEKYLNTITLESPLSGLSMIIQLSNFNNGIWTKNKNIDWNYKKGFDTISKIVMSVNLSNDDINIFNSFNFEFTNKRVQIKENKVYLNKLAQP